MTLVFTNNNYLYRLSPSWKLFTIEIEHLKRVFTKLKYPENLVNSAISKFIESVVQPRDTSVISQDGEKIVTIVLPYKDQGSANAVRKRLRDLGMGVGVA